MLYKCLVSKEKHGETCMNEGTTTILFPQRRRNTLYFSPITEGFPSIRRKQGFTSSPEVHGYLGHPLHKEEARGAHHELPALSPFVQLKCFLLKCLHSPSFHSGQTRPLPILGFCSICLLCYSKDISRCSEKDLKKCWMYGGIYLQVFYNSEIEMRGSGDTHNSNTDWLSTQHSVFIILFHPCNNPQEVWIIPILWRRKLKVKEIIA